MFYYLIFILIASLSFFDLFDHKYKIHVFLISFILLFLVSSLRFEVGLDEDAYRNIYNNIKIDFSTSNFSIFNYLQEPLFIFFNLLLIPFNSDQSIFVVFSFLSLFFLFISFKEFSNFNSLPLLIYFSHRFLHNDLNQIRQGLVSVIFLYSLIYIRKRFFFVLNFISIFFHFSGIIFFLYFLVKKYFSSPMTVLVLLIFSIFFSNFLTTDFLFGFIPDSSKILFYFQDERYNFSRNLFFSFSFYKVLLIFIFTSLNFDILKLNRTHFSVLYSVYAFGFFCLIIFQNIAIISGRISSLLFTVEPILIFYLIERFKLFSSRYFIYVVTILFCVFNLYLNLGLENSPVQTYKFIFSR